MVRTGVDSLVGGFVAVGVNQVDEFGGRSQAAGLVARAGDASSVLRDEQVAGRVADNSVKISHIRPTPNTAGLAATKARLDVAEKIVRRARSLAWSLVISKPVTARKSTI